MAKHYDPMMRFFNTQHDNAFQYPKFSSFQHREIFIRQRILASVELSDHLKGMVSKKLDTKREELENQTEIEKKNEDLENLKPNLTGGKQNKVGFEEEGRDPKTSSSCLYKFAPFSDAHEFALLENNEANLSETALQWENIDHKAQRDAYAELWPPSNNLLHPTNVKHALLRKCPRSTCSLGAIAEKFALDANFVALVKRTRLFVKQNKTNINDNNDNEENLTSKHYVGGNFGSSSDKFIPMHESGKEHSQNLFNLELEGRLTNQPPYVNLHDIKWNEQLKQIQIAFVGETTAKFTPIKGDLIIKRPGRNNPLTVESYVSTYKGPSTYKFGHGDLVIRIEVSNEPSSFFYTPYGNLSLFQYMMGGTWKFLGIQKELENMSHQSSSQSSNPGKYLSTGGFIECIGKFRPLVPRKGDIILRKSLWIDKFSHVENFWCSMIKWHKNKQAECAPEDRLLRLHVDREPSSASQSVVPSMSPVPGDHSACVPHGPCTQTHELPFPGYAELYECKPRGQNLGWKFWGRTPELHYECGSSSQTHHPDLILYAHDSGTEDFEMNDATQEENLNELL